MEEQAARMAFTANQVVAHNLRRARELRGLTQHQAADRLEPFLGVRWSKATFSAAERSVTGDRIREFTADDLLAFARAFKLNIAFFLTPPSGLGEYGLKAASERTSAETLMDAVIGLNDETRRRVLELVGMGPGGSEALRQWADDHAALVTQREEDIELLLAARDALRTPEGADAFRRQPDHDEAGDES